MADLGQAHFPFWVIHLDVFEDSVLSICQWSCISSLYKYVHFTGSFGRCVWGVIPFTMLVQWPFLSVLGSPKWVCCWSLSGTWMTVAGFSCAHRKASRTWRRPLRPRKSSQFLFVETRSSPIWYPKYFLNNIFRGIDSSPFGVKPCRTSWIKSKIYLTVFALLLRTESKPELVKTEMGPPPSPASTCSDTSSIASSASLPYSMFASLLPFFSFNLFSSQSPRHTTRFFPYSVLSSVLWHWNRWCTSFYQQIFFVPIFLWQVYSELTAYTVVYLVAFPLWVSRLNFSCYVILLLL